MNRSPWNTHDRTRSIWRGRLLIPVLVGAATLTSNSALPAAAATARFAASQLLLSNGKTLTTETPKASVGVYARTRFMVQLLGVPQDHPYGESVVGNHSQIVNQQWIQTPYGRAWFALNKRTAPAAAGHVKPTFEYWLAMSRPGPNGGTYDYCIEGFVTGSQATTKQAMLTVANRWVVPFNADATAKPPVTVTIAPHTQHLRLARAVQQYLNDVSDPNVFKSMSIRQISYLGKRMGHAVWQVSVVVHHQPGRSSAYNEGLNKRFVDFVSDGAKTYVFGLATGM